jgi:uncharacterized membrane protein YccF (DUF307 family)
LKTLGNILWFVLGGWYLALGYLLAGVLICLTIIGIPFGKASFRCARVALWPMGRTIVANHDRVPGASFVGNILWFILCGWWLAILHALAGVLLFITIVGIPFGLQSFKLAALAINPLGKRVVRSSDVARAVSSAGGN